MAYRVRQQDIRDLDRRKAIGVLMPFNSDSVFIPTYNSLEAYKVNLYNFFMTSRNERYLNPNLGNSLLQYLFTVNLEQTTYRNIQDNLRSEIESFFPKLEIVSIQVEGFPEENTLQIVIDFKVKGTELEDRLILDITR